MKFLFSLFFFFWVNISFSQLDVHEYYVENNKDFVFDSIIFSEKGHLFFSVLPTMASKNTTKRRAV